MIGKLGLNTGEIYRTQIAFQWQLKKANLELKTETFENS